MMSQSFSTSQNKPVHASLSELVRALAPTHMATFTLSSNANMNHVADSVNFWVKRVNRICLGRGWYRPDQLDRRMKGLAFFEYGRSGQSPHIHVLFRAPIADQSLNFEAAATYAFEGSATPVQGKSAIKPIARGGSIHLQRLGNTQGDIIRVTGYLTKEFLNKLNPSSGWVFLDDVSSASWRA